MARPSQLRERLIQVLQNTLLEVEASSGVAADDPALAALKSVILRRVANLELAGAEDEASTEESSVAAEVAPANEAGPPEVEITAQKLKQETTAENSATSANPSSIQKLAGAEQKHS